MSRSLLRAIPNHVHVVFVGDPDQLNSVGPGKVLYDLTEKLERFQTEKREYLRYLPKWTKLNKIHRTSAESRIPFLAKTLLLNNPKERWSFFQQESNL